MTTETHDVPTRLRHAALLPPNPHHVASWRQIEAKAAATVGAIFGGDPAATTLGTCEDPRAFDGQCGGGSLRSLRSAMDRNSPENCLMR
jgi:hypothetical protein